MVAQVSSEMGSSGALGYAALVRANRYQQNEARGNFDMIIRYPDVISTSPAISTRRSRITFASVAFEQSNLP